MKKTLLFASLFFVLAMKTNAQVGPDITSWIINPDSLANIDTGGNQGYESNVLLVQYSASKVYVTCNSIANYAVGPWPGNPNVPAPQYFDCEFPRNPSQDTAHAIWTYLGPIGLWSNGVAIYNQKDAHYWNNASSNFSMGEDTSGTGWNRNALVYEGVSFDNCLGHPDQSGCYHNHVNPKCLYNDADSTHHSPIIGYAFDGFPIYGAYGYASAMTPGTVKRMHSSYVLTTDTTRAGGPHPISTYPLGNMCEDYVYTPGAGDLDYYNGRYCVTPDYPSGTYAYFVTIDGNLNPVYPFVLGPKYYGYPASTRPKNPGIGPDTTYYGTTNVKAPAANIKYQVVPNPVDDYAYIYMDLSSVNNVKGSLYNTDGRLLKTIDYMQPSMAYTLDMSDLPAGMYMLSLQGGGKTVTEKIVKK